MLYLLDANVLITASNSYYALDQVPEYWEWLIYNGNKGNIKIPVGRKDDLLVEWIKNAMVETSLLLEEEVVQEHLQRVVYEGYADDLTDDEIESIGRDPFLISYAVQRKNYCIVTTEVSKPAARRQNRKIPDVCEFFSIECCNPFQMNRALNFRTNWNI
ncbi:DUF4411 family protein [bacterium]|nr:DUF4411 family protein [bacterium]